MLNKQQLLERAEIYRMRHAERSAHADGARWPAASEAPDLLLPEQPPECDWQPSVCDCLLDLDGAIKIASPKCQRHAKRNAQGRMKNE